MSAIDNYLTEVQPRQRAELERIRRIIKQTVPEAEETILYGMPAFKYNGKRLIEFAAYKNHMSLFGALGEMEKKLWESHSQTAMFTHIGTHSQLYR